MARGDVACLVLAHGYPRELARLAERLLHPRVQLFVHLDRKTPLAPYRAGLARPPANAVFLPERHVVQWGSYGMVRATLALLDAALRHPARFRYLSLHSELDYPLLPVDEIARRLAADERCFVETFPIEKGRSQALYLQRLRKLWWNDNPYLKERTRDARPTGRQRAVYRAFKRVRRLRGVRWPPAPWRPYYGSQWWTLPRDAAAFLVQAHARHGSLRRFFRWTAFPDEMYFHTMLMNSRWSRRCPEPGPPDACVDGWGGHLRHVDWAPDRERPSVLEPGDFGAIARSGAFFARKLVAERSWDLADAIDRELLAWPARAAEALPRPRAPRGAAVSA